MAKRFKGIEVSQPVAVKNQLRELYENMQMTYDEVKETMLDVVQAGADSIQADINEVLNRHELTGETRQHAIVPKAEVTAIGHYAYIHADAGVDLSGNLQDMKKGNGGYAALLLDYGRPKKRVQKNEKRKYKHSLAEPVRPREISACIRRGRKKAETAMIAECDKILKSRGFK